MTRFTTWMLVAIVLAGCGSFEPFATPFRPRPALPAGDAWPDIEVERVIEHIESFGFDCWYAPDSDIPGGWQCQEPDGGQPMTMQFAVSADETGPVWRVSTSLRFGGLDNDQEALDQEAAARFREMLIVALLPEAVHPSEVDMTEMVRANWPAELGEGWLLGFDRSSMDRRMSILYSLADAEAE